MNHYLTVDFLRFVLYYLLKDERVAPGCFLTHMVLLLLSCVFKCSFENFTFDDVELEGFDTFGYGNNMTRHHRYMLAYGLMLHNANFLIVLCS